jgi:hypothetical protein
MSADDDAERESQLNKFRALLESKSILLTQVIDVPVNVQVTEEGALAMDHLLVLSGYEQAGLQRTILTPAVAKTMLDALRKIENILDALGKEGTSPSVQ